MKGNVKDATGEPVIGASVLVKGTTNGTITDFDGNFELNDVSGNAVIEVTFVGYLPQEVKVSSTPLNIILKEDTKTLDEVVVIGYGVQKKSVVTASIAKVGSDELGKTAPVTVFRSTPYGAGRSWRSWLSGATLSRGNLLKPLHTGIQLSSFLHSGGKPPALNVRFLTMFESL